MTNTYYYSVFLDHLNCIWLSKLRMYGVTPQNILINLLTHFWEPLWEQVLLFSCCPFGMLLEEESQRSNKNRLNYAAIIRIRTLSCFALMGHNLSFVLQVSDFCFVSMCILIKAQKRSRLLSKWFVVAIVHIKCAACLYLHTYAIVGLISISSEYWHSKWV